VIKMEAKISKEEEKEENMSESEFYEKLRKIEEFIKNKLKDRTVSKEVKKLVEENGVTKVALNFLFGLI